MANRRGIEGFPIATAFRIRPYAGCQHQSDCLARLGSAPQVQKKRIRAAGLNKHAGQTGGERHAGLHRAFAADSQDCVHPRFRRAGWRVYGLVNAPEGIRLVEHSALQIGAERVEIIHPPKPVEGLDLWHHIVVARLNIAQIAHQILRVVRVHAYALIGQLDDLVLAGQYAFRADRRAPARAALVGKLDLFHSSAGVHKPSERRDDVRTGIDLLTLLADAIDAQLVARPVSEVVFGRILQAVFGERDDVSAVDDGQSFPGFSVLVEGLFELVEADRASRVAKHGKGALSGKWIVDIVQKFIGFCRKQELFLGIGLWNDSVFDRALNNLAFLFSLDLCFCQCITPSPLIGCCANQSS